MKKRDKIYFLSDLHLGSRMFADSKAAEKRVVAFLDSIKEEAKAIYLVGDIIDYWFEYRYVVPKGHVRFLGKIAELADSGIEIVWFTGNHDTWIFDYLPAELGIKVEREPVVKEIDGKRFFIEHGDGVGDLPRKLRLLRGVFHNKVCQKLFSSVHPRWTVPLGLGWSHSNRKHHCVSPAYKGEDCEPLVIFAKDYLNTHQIDYFIFGHRHIFLEQSIKSTDGLRKAKVIFLGEWIETFSYAVFDGNQITLHKFI